MVRLYDDLPESVTVAGTEYALDLMFDNVLLAFSALKDEAMTIPDRLETFLMALMPEVIPDSDEWEEAFNACLLYTSDAADE